MLFTIPAVYTAVMAAWLVFTPPLYAHGHNEADLRGLEKRLTAVEERVSLLEEALSKGLELRGGSQLKALVREVREPEDVVRLFQAIDQGKLRIQSDAESPRVNPPPPQKAPAKAEAIFEILEAFAKGRAGGGRR